MLNRAVRELPVRPAAGGAGVDLIAKPWGIGDGTFQLGGFPSGWAEWNGSFRDSLRTGQNKLGVAKTVPAELVTRFAGSADLFQSNGRKPWHSVNFLVAHDGFTLRDLYSYNNKQNNQAYPFGPSDGGTDNNISWDQGGDATLQRQAVRTGLAILIDCTESAAADSVVSIYMAYDGWSDWVTAALPANLPGKRWYRVADTAGWMESRDNFNAPGQEELLSSNSYALAGRSVLLLIEQ